MIGPVPSSRARLIGREREQGVLDRLLESERGGVLVVDGEAGVGKTALLEYAIDAAHEFRMRVRVLDFPSRDPSVVLSHA